MSAAAARAGCTTRACAGPCCQSPLGGDHSLGHLEHEVGQEARKAHLLSAVMSIMELTPKKCSALSFSGSSGSGARPSTPSIRTHTPSATTMAWD